MTILTKSTLKMLCVRVGIERTEILEEAQKLLETFEDPATSPEERERVKVELDRKIREIENRVTTRRLREAREKDRKTKVPEPPVS